MDACEKELGNRDKTRHAVLHGVKLCHDEKFCCVIVQDKRKGHGKSKLITWQHLAT